MWRSTVMNLSVCVFVCLCVCLSVREHISGTTCPIVTKFFVRALLGPPLAALWYVVYFRFYEWHDYLHTTNRMDTSMDTAAASDVTASSCAGHSAAAGYHYLCRVLDVGGRPGADLGGWLGWLVTPWRGSISRCYYYACDLSYFDVVLCPSSSQSLATPLHQEIIILMNNRNILSWNNSCIKAIYTSVIVS